MIRLFDRLRSAVSARDADAAPAAPDEGPNPIRYVLTEAVADASPRSLISLLGAVPDNAGEMLESVALACRGSGEFPVAVMSELRPGLIAVASLPIEFIPTRRYLPVRLDEYERHVRRRWSLMIAKWEFARQIELGESFDTFLSGELQQ